MRQVAFTELRNHAKAFFDLVETGETIRILRNGKPISGKWCLTPFEFIERL